MTGGILGAVLLLSVLCYGVGQTGTFWQSPPFVRVLGLAGLLLGLLWLAILSFISVFEADR
jgi:hypothetical protein